MSAVTSNGVHYMRVVYCDIDNITHTLLGKLIKEDYIQEATDMGTTELSSYDLKRLEDDVRTQATLTEDECGDITSITEDELEDLKIDLGVDVYDALLQEEIDIVMLVQE